MRKLDMTKGEFAKYYFDEYSRWGKVVNKVISASRATAQPDVAFPGEIPPGSQKTPWRDK
jgi:hypothetical protein